MRPFGRFLDAFHWPLPSGECRHAQGAGRGVQAGAHRRGLSERRGLLRMQRRGLLELVWGSWKGSGCFCHEWNQGLNFDKLVVPWWSNFDPYPSRLSMAKDAAPEHRFVAFGFLRARGDVRWTGCRPSGTRGSQSPPPPVLRCCTRPWTGVFFFPFFPSPFPFLIVFLSPFLFFLLLLFFSSPFFVFCFFGVLIGK